MIPPNIQKWIAALRSDKYGQTSGFLKDEQGYCCLGVACEISKLGNWEVANPFSNFNYCIEGEDQQEYNYLPTSVTEWLGLKNSVGWFGSGNDMDGYKNLIELNDEEKLNFNKIADFIEENWFDMVTFEIKKEYA